jgi:excisionase family DNA binding protein
VLHTTHWLTAPEMAERLGISVRTVRQWAREGKLHGLLAGRRGGWRFPPEEAHRLLDEEVRLRQGLPPIPERRDG